MGVYIWVYSTLNEHNCLVDGDMYFKDHQAKTVGEMGSFYTINKVSDKDRSTAIIDYIA